MGSYLLTWNPSKWNWDNFNECINAINKDGYFSDNWSCGRTKRIIKGDRIFLIRLGSKPRGIIASGWSTSSYYEDEHWDETKKIPALYIDIKLDVLLDPEQEPIFSGTYLKSGILANMHWFPQSSGIKIPDDIAKQLEDDWAIFLLNKNIIQQHTAIKLKKLPEEVILNDRKYLEGKTKQIKINKYERNTIARRKCIKEHGLNCYVCGFNFQEKYGDIGIGFIHVHHLKPLSEIGEEYELNPVKDLRPVCPNCHAMIHRKNPALTIEELKSIILSRS